MGAVTCLQFSKTAKGILFRHTRHLKNTFLRQRTRIVDFAAKGECSGKSETSSKGENQDLLWTCVRLHKDSNSLHCCTDVLWPKMYQHKTFSVRLPTATASTRDSSDLLSHEKSYQQYTKPTCLWKGVHDQCGYQQEHRETMISHPTAASALIRYTHTNQLQKLRQMQRKSRSLKQMPHPQHHQVTICIQVGQSKCLLFKS